MSSKTQNVGHFVEYRLKRIVNSSSDGAVKASLANLRWESGQPREIFRSFGNCFYRIYPKKC